MVFDRRPSGPAECFTISRRLYGEEEEGRQEDGEEDREEEEEVTRGDAQGPAILPAPRISVYCAA
jgi:hypothetical protein